MQTNRKFWRAAAAGAGALAAGVFAYSFLVERFWIQVTRTRIHVRGLPPAAEGLRIALLSDMHAGGMNPLALTRRAVRKTMAAAPDLIAVTGDLAADDAESFDPVLSVLAELRAPLGVYVVPGNHDYTVGMDLWLAGMRRHRSLTDLTNRWEIVTLDGARICIAGVDDYYAGDPWLMLPPPDQRDLTILLAHGPDQAEHVRREHDDVDLVLSGHTHGGQVKVPGIGAAVNSAENKDLYVEGLRRRPWTQVYTSRGLGTVRLPLRFMSRPELAILELTADARPVRQPPRLYNAS